ncbi:MAG: hypothetical protein A2X23_07960 [Chloroflexi bacterium GWC2_73_18]|nr:MAG: hypothetical protein A2X23_07960 [Chloroflexi bacterium GWC2_73_18]
MGGILHLHRLDVGGTAGDLLRIHHEGPDGGAGRIDELVTLEAHGLLLTELVGRGRNGSLSRWRGRRVLQDAGPAIDPA